MKQNKITNNNLQDIFINKIIALKKKALLAYLWATSRLEQTDSPLSIFNNKTNFDLYWADLRIVINHYELCDLATFKQFKQAFARLQLKYMNIDQLEQACWYANLAEQFPKKHLLIAKIETLSKQ